MNFYFLKQLRCLFAKKISIHMKDYIIPLSQCFESSDVIIHRRQARLESGSRKRWLFFKSRHVFLTTITFLILFILNPVEGFTWPDWFTTAPNCQNNLKLTKAVYYSKSKQFKYQWEGTCRHPCAESLTYSTVTLKTSYDGAKHKAAEKLTFPVGETCEVEISMTGCLYNPFTDFPIKGLSNGCGNRLVAVNGCNEAYSLVPDNGFITEGMVPRNVAYSEGGSPPPPPPSSPPKGAYEVKRIVSPAGSILDNETEITFALEPRLSKYPPKRIVAHWELAPKKSDEQSGTQLEFKKGIKGGPMPTVSWTYYEKVPTNWDEFPLKISTSFFPSRGKTYRVRVYAETPDGEWIGPTEWNYFSIGTIIEKKQKSFPQLAPVADLTIEEFISHSLTSWQGKKGWVLRWKFKNVGTKPATDPKYRIQCDIVKGSTAYEEMCTEIERSGYLPGTLSPGQPIDSAPTDVIYEPDTEELFKLKITAIVDPEDEISESVLGEKNNKLVSFITNIPVQLEQKADFPVQTQASSQYANKEAKILTGKGEKKDSSKTIKGGGFVPKGEIIAIGKDENKVPRSGDVKLFDGSGPIQQGPGGPPALKIISPIDLQTVNVNADGIFYIGAKTNPGFEFPDIVRLRFERKEEIPKGGEVEIPNKGATHWWETVLVNDWGWPVKDAPIPVSESTPGFYRVRIRGLTHGGHDDIGGWTPWRYFCIGSNQNCQRVVKKTKVVEKQVTQLEKGGGFVPQRKDMQAQALSPSEGYGSYTGTRSVGKRKMSSSSDITEKTKVKSRVATIQKTKANIVVQSISYTAPQGRKLGEPFYEGEGTALSISFRNTGKAKSEKNHKYTISCNVNSGGPECPVQNETKSIAKEIKPNDTALVLLSATLNKAGEYHVTVKVIGERSVSQKTVKLNVIKTLKIQPKSKTKTIRAVPGAR